MLRASTAATIRVPSVKANVAGSIKLVIGIVQVSPLRMVAYEAPRPSQAAVSSRKTPSAPLTFTRYARRGAEPSKASKGHVRTTSVPEFVVVAAVGASGTEAIRIDYTGE